MSNEFNGGQRRNRTKRMAKAKNDSAKLNKDASVQGNNDEPNEYKFRRNTRKKKSVFQGILGNLGNPKIVISSPQSHYNMYHQISSTGYKSKIPG